MIWGIPFANPKLMIGMGLGIVYREICLKCGGNSRTDAERLKNEVA